MIFTSRLTKLDRDGSAMRYNKKAPLASQQGLKC
jgi:hypothetical protein